MDPELDDHGQPVNVLFNRWRNFDRDLSEMVGLIRGILADEVLNDDEIKFAEDWLRAHAEIRTQWPGDVLFRRVEKALVDGCVSESERGDLMQLFRKLSRGDVKTLDGTQLSTILPIDVPPPTLVFRNHVFVLSGTFAFGPRKECERYTEEAGGRCESAVTKRTHYLVIGTFVSRDWAHSIYGRKIERAIDLKTEGSLLAIVSEDHWAASMK